LVRGWDHQTQFGRGPSNDYFIKVWLKLCLAVALSHQDGHHSAVALLLKAALIQVSDYRLLGASGIENSAPDPLTHVKLQKSTVEFHTSKNILKMIKQRNQSRQVLFYISNTHFYTLVCLFRNQ
jgi:hypothetical protein